MAVLVKAGKKSGDEARRIVRKKEGRRVKGAWCVEGHSPQRDGHYLLFLFWVTCSVFCFTTYFFHHHKACYFFHLTLELHM